MRLSSVDLPQPDGPITATNSPALTVTSTPRSARTGAFSASNVLRTPRATNTSSDIADLSDLVGLHGRVAPFDELWRQGLGLNVDRQLFHRDVVDHGLPRARELLESLRHVHGVSDDRVLDALL